MENVEINEIIMCSAISGNLENKTIIVGVKNPNNQQILSMNDDLLL